ncbi:MAG: 4-(cytidine 5'-diphospho)-2-C-methyl-D-erythritol kinase [Elusimicrobiota bacterium]
MIRKDKIIFHGAAKKRPVSNGVKMLAPAKINLFLEVAGRRPDGYHNIETIFRTVSLYDELGFSRRKEGITVKCNIPELRSDKRNLVYRAAELLKTRLGVAAGVEIRLKKRIPMGAGLGGGSSDAAAALKGLLKLWKRKVSEKELVRLAAGLGADVPFFLYGGLAEAKGIGDRIKTIKRSKTDWFLLVNPGFPVSTASVYKKLKFPLTNKQKIHKIKQLLAGGSSPEKWGKHIFNRLEEAVLPCHRAIREIKDTLELMGCRCLMSGSGSTVFAPMSSVTEGERIRQKLSKFSWDVWLVKSVS